MIPSTSGASPLPRAPARQHVGTGQWPLITDLHGWDGTTLWMPPEARGIVGVMQLSDGARSGHATRVRRWRRLMAKSSGPPPGDDLFGDLVGSGATSGPLAGTHASA